MLSATVVVPHLLTNPPLRRHSLIQISNSGNTDTVMLVLLHKVPPSIECVSALILAPLTTRRVDRNITIPLQCSCVIDGGEYQRKQEELNGFASHRS
jgi:hypothetical protein